MARNLRVGVQRGLRQSIGGGLGTGDIFTLSPASFDFSRTNTKDSRITFTRASSGTFVGADGLIKTTPVNFIPRSEQLDQWNKYFGAIVTANATAAPDGTLTADKVDLSAGGIAQVTKNFSGLTPGATYTLSFYGKSVTGTENILVYRPIPTFNFTLTTEWQRFTATITQPADATTNAVNFLYSGSNATMEFFIWGVQFEEGSVATDYIPTQSTISGAPRFDHDPVTGESLGLLIEESRTNLMTRSEQLDEWTKYFGASVTSNSIAAPDGTVTADLVDISPQQFSQILRLFDCQPSTTYTVSFYGKSVTGTEIISLFRTPSRGGVVNFTLTTEWQRFTNTYTTLSTDTTVNNVLFTRREGSTNQFYMWGVQVEEGTFATSYIPTTDSTVTRAADVAEIAGTNFSSFYNQSKGTVFAEYNVLGDKTGFSQFIYDFSDGTNDNALRQFKRSGNNETVSTARTNGNIQGRIEGNTNTPFNERYKTAYALDGTDAQRAIKGIASSESGVSMPTVDQLRLGGRQDNTFLATCHISRFVYFPTRLTDATLESITS